LRPAKKREDPPPSENWEFVERPQQQQQQQQQQQKPTKPGFIEAAIKKSTNALKSRPRKNSKTPPSRPSTAQQSREYAPVHRPPPMPKQPLMSAAELRAGYGDSRQYSGAMSDYGARGMTSSSTASEYPAPSPSRAGYAMPGNKQPRSRDRMRSTSVHYDALATVKSSMTQAAPAPQEPMFSRAPIPDYGSQQRHYQPPKMPASRTRSRSFAQNDYYETPMFGAQDVPLPTTTYNNVGRGNDRAQPVQTNSSGGYYSQQYDIPPPPRPPTSSFQGYQQTPAGNPNNQRRPMTSSGAMPSGGRHYQQ
ncbi:hypothetical protein FBU59_005888, partial [Linderina macrospora]